MVRDSGPAVVTYTHQCIAVTDGLRCSYEALHDGYCYYHNKMAQGLIQPSKEVDIVQNIIGVTLYKSNQKKKK